MFRRLATVTAALVLAVAAALTANPAQAIPAPKPPHDYVTPTVPAAQSWYLPVHESAHDTDGDGGSWAWAELGYHPLGWRVNAGAPSSAAHVIRSAEVGDGIHLDGRVCGDFVVSSIPTTVVKVSYDVGEDNVLFTVALANGGWYYMVADKVPDHFPGC